MIFKRIFNNFLFGELTPLLAARVDLELYRKGAQTLKNLIVLATGGATLRPGTKYVAESSIGTANPIRTITFSVSQTESFIIEIGGSTGNGKAYFYKDHAQVLSGASPFSVSVPWDGDEVSELKYVKIDNVIYIAHQDHAVRTLTYGGTSDIDWTLATASFSGTYTFATATNYPKAIAYWNQRLILGGTETDPTTIWMSKVGAPTNFTSGSADEDAKELILNSDDNDRINWIAAGSILMAGTLSGEWLLTDTQAIKQTTYGSNQLQGKLINNFVLFSQRAGRRLREYFYQDQTATYTATDLSAAAEHITKPSIIDLAFQQDPDSIVWMIREDGVLLGLSRDQGQGNIAWHRHITDGDFETVAVIPTATHDEIWVSVIRNIGGTDKRYFEYFEAREFDSQADHYHVDCGLTDEKDTGVITGITQANPAVVTSAAHGLSNGDVVYIDEIVGMTSLNTRVFTVAGATTDTFQLSGIDTTGADAYTSGGKWIKDAYTVSGLSHLEGKDVSVVIDGGPHDDCTVSSGSITLDSPGEKIHVGLFEEAECTPMPIALPGQTVRIVNGAVRLYETLGCKINGEVIDFRESTTTIGNAPDMFTGDKDVPLPLLQDNEGNITITQPQPLPFTLIGITGTVEVSESETNYA